MAMNPSYTTRRLKTGREYVARFFGGHCKQAVIGLVGVIIVGVFSGLAES